MASKSFIGRIKPRIRILRPAANLLLGWFYPAPRVQSIKNSISEIVTNKCSVSRYGDGEMDIIVGKSQPFQMFNEELSRRLNDVLTSNVPGHMVCIPDAFGSIEEYRPESQAFWKGHLRKHRLDWYKRLKIFRIYGNTHMTRCYNMYADKSKAGDWFAMLKEVWEQRDVVMVEGEKSRLGVGNDLFENARSLVRILCPAEHAFSKYCAILNEVKKQDRAKLILIALGPTATVLAFDLHKLGYQAIDVGHLDIEYEWYLRRAPGKVKVENKYVNEVAGGRDVGDIADPQYQQQVAARIL